MMYDPTARRDTPLALKLKHQITRDGPLPLKQFVNACLQDRDHGYYRKRTAIGAKGDFVTAPEITQIFGELIGLWSAVVWSSIGAPAAFQLIELGPGRGTLMQDALRATRAVPGFLDAANVALVETSERLSAEQRRTLAAFGKAVTWYGALADVPAGPSIVIANEFLDVFPADQFKRSSAGWAKAHVGVVDDRLEFVWLPTGAAHASMPSAADGEIVELKGYSDVGFALGSRVSKHRGGNAHACLFIDYGDSHINADSLQAVRNHTSEHPLTSPGEADLTFQVDFAVAAHDLSRCRELFGDGDPTPLLVDGPVTQAEFLGALGIIERASRLIAASPARANAIEMGVARLMNPQGMGTRFKVLGVRTADVPLLPGFPANGFPASGRGPR
jgi:NADH dehydrogenase [ubiquinone] 1 alpha subcomplex assembly factor 7